MSKQRMIKDSFWTDPYIEKLTPDEKLTFLYLLTNPQCNIAGVYEVRPRRIAYETGYDTEIIETILKRFVRDKKIIRHKDWIIIVNHIKHQSLGNLTAEGINRVINDAPQEVKSLFTEQEYSNTKGETYTVFVLKDIPLISPIQAPIHGAYSEVKLSIVKLSSNYGELQKVKLEENEYKKLIESIGEQQTQELIKQLDLYIASTGKKYKSHYATILAWSRRKQEKQNSRGKSVSVIN